MLRRKKCNNYLNDNMPDMHGKFHKFKIQQTYVCTCKKKLEYIQVKKNLMVIFFRAFTSIRFIYANISLESPI